MSQKPVLVHVTASLSLGGAETVLCTLVHGLRPFFTQYVISLHDGPFREKIEHLGISVFIISGSAPVRFFKKLDHLNPAIIHSLLWSANALTRVYARVRNIPLVCAIHSPFNTNTGNSMLRTLFDRFTAEWATKTVFVSPTLVREATIAPYVPLEQQMTIANGIDVDELRELAQKKAKTREQLGFKTTDFVIGTVGRLVPVKNHQLLIQVVNNLRNQYPNVRLIIVGHGQLQIELERQARDYGIQEHVRIVQGAGYEYYQLFDCFVQPSLTEGLSMALLEAMSFRLPVVVSSTTGIHPVVTHGQTGFIFNPQSCDELATCIERLIEHKDLRVSCGHGGEKIVSKYYTAHAMIEAYTRIFTFLTTHR